MLEHKVLRTIPVGRHVLVIADVLVEPGADIAGRPRAGIGELRRKALDHLAGDPDHDLARDGPCHVLSRLQRPVAGGDDQLDV